MSRRPPLAAARSVGDGPGVDGPVVDGSVVDGPGVDGPGVDGSGGAVSAADVALAAAVTALTVLGTANLVGDALDVPGAVLLAVAGLGLVAHRRHPLAVFVLALACHVTYLASGQPEGLDWVPTTVALGSLTAARGWRWGVPLALVCLGLSWDGDPVTGADAALEPLLVVVGLGCAVAVGEWLRTRRAYLAAVAERAAAQERSRREEARRLVDAERLRIAREVHDVVAHAMASISVQAGVGEHLAARDPARATDALATIRRASGDALDDLRGLLGALRLAEAPRPAPGVADLDAVAATARSAGMRVTVEVADAVGALPPEVDAAAFRIVQEAVTNALRHGRADHVDVVVAVVDGALEVRVRDPGPARAVAAADAVAGHGIRGMRERAALLGGRLEAGPRPDGSFVVRAVLPLPDEAR